MDINEILNANDKLISDIKGTNNPLISNLISKLDVSDEMIRKYDLNEFIECKLINALRYIKETELMYKLSNEAVYPNNLFTLINKFSEITNKVDIITGEDISMVEMKSVDDLLKWQYKECKVGIVEQTIGYRPVTTFLIILTEEDEFLLDYLRRYADKDYSEALDNIFHAVKRHLSVYTIDECISSNPVHNLLFKTTGKSTKKYLITHKYLD